MQIDIQIPETIKIENNQVKIDLENWGQNVFNINGIDYIPYYLDNYTQKNKGGNGNVLKLVEAQGLGEHEVYPFEPDKIIKICKNWINKYGRDNFKSAQFKTELDILKNCQDLPNIVIMHDYGKAWISTKERNSKKQYYFYTMEFAKDDLSSFLEKNDLEFLDRIELSIEVCESLKQLYSRGYYHRDLKPDNILFVGESWKISDLGLATHRDEDKANEFKGGWIGPRGWMSPESINKFLAEGKPWEGYHDCKIDHKSDLFQIGKVIWYILHGSSPEGSIRRDDYYWRGETVYQVLKTLLNHNKKRRYDHISDVIENLKRFWNTSYKTRS